MSAIAKKSHVWSPAQIKFVTECTLLGREFYAAFRRRFKVPASKLSDQAIRGRRVAIYKANGWS